MNSPLLRPHSDWVQSQVEATAKPSAPSELRRQSENISAAEQDSKTSMFITASPSPTVTLRKLTWEKLKSQLVIGFSDN